MSLRNRFMKAMRRKSEEYIPYEFELCPSQIQEFKKHAGTDDYFEYFKFPYRWAGPRFTGDISRYGIHFSDLNNIKIDDWGVGYKAGQVAHFTEMQHPMKDFQTLEEFKKYPYPDPEMDYNWDDVAPSVKSIIERDLIAIAAMQITIFEIAWYLRGMDNFMIDMIENPELAEYHLDRITEIRCEFARRYAKTGFDILFLGDDIATQLDMMMHPDMWRKFLKVRLHKVILAAKEIKPDIMIAYHSDGNIRKVISDLIEIGVEILNPIQPECMDPVEIKREYGDKLSFWGTIGTQTTMPFGSAEEVSQMCKRMITEVGKGGGLLLAPTHTVEPEVPWENIQAFLDAVIKHNRDSSLLAVNRDK